MSSTYGAFTLDSTSFQHQQKLADKHAYPDCQHNKSLHHVNISPELHWSGAPEKTRCFVLICRDPDAPARPKGFIHWIIINIPNTVTHIPEGLPKEELLSGDLKGAIQGVNDYGNIGWDGPCPPAGTHRYFFELYALDSPLDAHGAPSVKKIEDQLTAKTVAKVSIMGTFSHAHAEEK